MEVRRSDHRLLLMLVKIRIMLVFRVWCIDWVVAA